MSKPLKKSAPFYFKSAPPIVEKDKNVIRDVVIIQEFVGNDTDAYGENFGLDFLEAIVEQGNAQTQGVKSRFGHPSMCGPSALGTFVGRFKNFRISKNTDGKNVAIADLHIDDKAANASPTNGRQGDYIMMMALENPDMIGNSIVFIPKNEPRIEVEKDDEGNDYFRFYTLLESFLASDIVDSPAATDHLFKDVSDKDTGLQIEQFLDQHPDIVDSILQALSKDENVFHTYLLKYLNNDSKMDKGKANKTAAQLKDDLLAKKKKELADAKKKAFDSPTKGGITVTISDEDGDGKPAVGDKITNKETGEPVSGTTEFTDGSTVTSGEDGVITETSGAPADEDDSQKELTRLKGVDVVNQKKIKQLEAELQSAKDEAALFESALDDSVKENLKLKSDLQKVEGKHKVKSGEEKFDNHDEPATERDFKKEKADRKASYNKKDKAEN